jgi:hypothetical protein
LADFRKVSPTSSCRPILIARFVSASPICGAVGVVVIVVRFSWRFAACQDPISACLRPASSPLTTGEIAEVDLARVPFKYGNQNRPELAYFFHQKPGTMQKKKDAALRSIVVNENLTIRTRREALAAMDAPSRLFLNRLANDVNVPAKLRLDAARRLPEVEKRLAEGRAARKPAPERSEIDRHLFEAANELGIELDAGEPKRRAESSSEVGDEPHQADLSVPADEISSRPESPVPITNEVRKTDTRTLADRGRAVAKRVLEQYERFYVAPFNAQEGARLDTLRKEFGEWKSEAERAGIDARALFGDKLPLLEPPAAKRLPIPTTNIMGLALLTEELDKAQKRSNESTTDQCCGAPMWEGLPGI